MKSVKGNLLSMFADNGFDVIIHGCNTQADMSGGVALQIAKEYPDAAKADYFANAKLGEYSMAYVERPNGLTGLIVNAYTQPLPGANANLFGIAKAFRKLKEDGVLDGVRVGIPQIGAGIGGLLWSDVELVLDRLGLDNVWVVEYVPS